MPIPLKFDSSVSINAGRVTVAIRERAGVVGKQMIVYEDGDCHGKIIATSVAGAMAVADAVSRLAKHMRKGLFEDCRGCGRELLAENRTMADGCPCNSPRGVNHGFVDMLVCTCNSCDPDSTGSSRWGVVHPG